MRYLGDTCPVISAAGKTRIHYYLIITDTPEGKRMNTTSKSVKVTVGALAIGLAVLGLTACGGHGGAKQKSQELMGPMLGSSSVQFEVGNAVQ